MHIIISCRNVQVSGYFEAVVYIASFRSLLDEDALTSTTRDVTLVRSRAKYRRIL